MASEACWFETWFDSPYYHLLYNNRDETEAEFFLGNLFRVLSPSPGSKILDLACGKGRHARFIHQMGFETDGVDLSESSIAYAKTTEKPGLRFWVGDMRAPQGQEEYDLVLNLFTSFGYFETEAENLDALRAMKTALKPGGLLVVDYFNRNRVLAQLREYQELERGGVRFAITKSLVNHQIIKQIAFTDQGKTWNFEERVQALRESDFRRYFEITGFECVLLSGNYAMEPFRSEESERLIFVVRKPQP